MPQDTSSVRIAYLLADTPIPDDPRVRRVGDLLHHAGWVVTGIGLGGWRSPPPEWPVLTPPPLIPRPQGAPSSAGADLAPPQLMLQPRSAAREALKSVWRKIAWAGAMALAPASLAIGAVSSRSGAAFELRRKSLRDDISWPLRQMRRVRNGMARLTQLALRTPKWLRLHAGLHGTVEDDFLYRATPHLKALKEVALTQTSPGVWIANDWRLLPIAAAAATEIGGRFVYDSHEFATEEYAERLTWRLFQRPVAAAVEKRWIGKAAAVVSVSPGITAALKDMYGLEAPTDTIRNTPVFESTSFRATGPKIEILYHGVVSPGRGLEACIRAAPMLRPEFQLSIRGPSGLPGYRESLEALILEVDAKDRVRLLPPVAMTDLVRAASAFDIGVMALPGHSAHNEFALPNKIFEYMMAGLALCVSDLPAMSEVIDATGAGVRMRAVTPEAIAEALNALDRGRIDTMKQAALNAAQTYNWNVEGGRFMALLDQVRAGTL